MRGSNKVVMGSKDTRVDIIKREVGVGTSRSASGWAQGTKKK